MPIHQKISAESLSKGKRRKIKSPLNVTIFTLFIFLAFFVASRISEAWQLVTPPHWGLDWRLTQWLFTYEFGFIKRGLVGSVITLINAQPGYYFLTVCSFIVLFLLVYMLFHYSIKRLSPLNFARLTFFLLFLLSSATFQQLSGNLGRFDHFGLIILLSVLFILELDFSRVKWVIIPLCTVGILIHEAFFLLFFPFVFAASFYGLKDHPEQKIFLVSLGSVAFVTLFFVTGMGSMESMDKGSYLTLLEQKTDFSPVESSVMVLYRGFGENVAYSFNALFTRGTLYNHFILFIWQSPTFAALYLLLRSLYRKARELKEEFYVTLLIAGSLTPLLIYPVGRDFYRWIAVAMLNIFLLILFLCWDKTYLKCLEETAYKYKLLILIAAAVSLIVGPIGVEEGHPVKLIQVFRQLL